jgi:hypothetical protein
VGILLITTLWLNRARPSVRLASACFMINSAAIATAFYMTNAAFAALGPRWVPFQGDKFAALLAAVLAPSVASGTASILLYAGLAALQFQMFPPELRQSLAVGEPWTVLAFGLVALLLLAFRFARVALERQVAAAEREVEATRALAAKIMGIKDLLNTPLQSLDLAVAILKEEGAADPALLDRVGRAVESIAATTRALSKYETLLNADRRALSFDSMQVVDPKGRSLEAP